MQATTQPTPRKAKRPAVADLDTLRFVRLDKFTVRTFALNATDSRGQTAIGYRVTESGRIVAECYDPRDAVYGSPLHADDSDACVASAIALICHAATHDDNDRPVDPAWDASELSDLAAMRWEGE